MHPTCKLCATRRKLKNIDRKMEKLTGWSVKTSELSEG